MQDVVVVLCRFVEKLHGVVVGYMVSVFRVRWVFREDPGPLGIGRSRDSRVNGSTSGVR